GDRLLVDQDLAAVGGVQPVRDVPQGGFSGPALAQQGVDLPGPAGDGAGTVGPERPEGRCDGAQFERRTTRLRPLRPRAAGRAKGWEADQVSPPRRCDGPGGLLGHLGGFLGAGRSPGRGPARWRGRDPVTSPDQDCSGAASVSISTVPSMISWVSDSISSVSSAGTSSSKSW